LPGVVRGDVRPFGFSHEVDVLLAASDVLVGKAGGLTCAEALVKGVPMVIFRPTPGQETRNAAVLGKAGAAVTASHLDEVEAAVGRILGDATARERMREAAARLARPGAATAIARDVLARVAAARSRV
jgi:processive 1,2-diacylglycerol beta-glucosyltransferase